MEKHLTELLDGRYGEVVELWFDGAWINRAAHGSWIGYITM